MTRGIRISEANANKMEDTVRPRQLEVPLQLEFAMRKAELEAREMTWDQLYASLLNLYKKRLLEWAAVKDILQDENIELEFNCPTQLELMELAVMFEDDEDDEDDDNELMSVF